ncbi:hypothetical protein QNN00_07385 [Bacillus velezensis]|nr:hypothetical protein [Bacillus velezensis]
MKTQASGIRKYIVYDIGTGDPDAYGNACRNCASGKSTLYETFKFIGDPVTALLIATVYSFFSLGFYQGFDRESILKFSNDCLGPIASILLVIGAGGAFNNVLIDSGVGTYIADMAKHSSFSPVLLSWTIAAVIRVATGSATVAMMTAAGIVAPIASVMPGVSSELLVLATERAL